LYAPRASRHALSRWIQTRMVPCRRSANDQTKADTARASGRAVTFHFLVIEKSARTTVCENPGGALFARDNEYGYAASSVILIGFLSVTACPADAQDRFSHPSSYWRSSLASLHRRATTSVRIMDRHPLPRLRNRGLILLQRFLAAILLSPGMSPMGSLGRPISEPHR